MASAEAIQAIDGYVRKCGRDYSQWCIGVAADPVGRLLGDHGVAEEGDGCGWITYGCASADEAGEVRQHFVGKGMRAAKYAADASTLSVYVFKVTGSTRY